MDEAREGTVGGEVQVFAADDEALQGDDATEEEGEEHAVLLIASS
jgi:hypothetical protein